MEKVRRQEIAEAVVVKVVEAEVVVEAQDVTVKTVLRHHHLHRLQVIPKRADVEAAAHSPHQAAAAVVVLAARRALKRSKQKLNDDRERWRTKKERERRERRRRGAIHYMSIDLVVVLCYFGVLLCTWCIALYVTQHCCAGRCVCCVCCVWYQENQPSATLSMPIAVR